MSERHAWKMRRPGTRRVERNVSGTSPRYFDEAIPPYEVCSKCGVRREAADLFGWTDCAGGTDG